jgi:hypothetical protein
MLSSFANSCRNCPRRNKRVESIVCPLKQSGSTRVALDYVSSRIKTWKSASVVFCVARGYEMRRSQGFFRLFGSRPVGRTALLSTFYPIGCSGGCSGFSNFWHMALASNSVHTASIPIEIQRYLPSLSDVKPTPQHGGPPQYWVFEYWVLHPTQAPQLGTVEGLEIERVGQRFG